MAKSDKPTKDSLTDAQAAQLRKLEKTIAERKDSAIKFIEAFFVIKTQKLYRENYSTFEEYCSKKWGKTVSAINKMLRAFEIRKEIVKELENGSPSVNQSNLEALTQASSAKAIRELARVPKKKRGEILASTAKRNKGQVTAAAVRAEVARAAHRAAPGKGHRSAPMADDLKQGRTLGDLGSSVYTSAPKVKNSGDVEIGSFKADGEFVPATKQEGDTAVAHVFTMADVKVWQDRLRERLWDWWKKNQKELADCRASEMVQRFDELIEFAL